MNIEYRNIKYAIAFIMLSLSAFPAFPSEPEFDGGYVKLSDSSLVELKKVSFHKTKLVEGTTNIMAVMKQKHVYYTVDKQAALPVKADDLEALVIKGGYDFGRFSLHPLISKDTTGLGFFENKGPARAGSPFYFPGQSIEVNSKSIGADAYYFQPKENLQSGDYVAWISNNFWLFTIE